MPVNYDSQDMHQPPYLLVNIPFTITINLPGDGGDGGNMIQGGLIESQYAHAHAHAHAHANTTHPVLPAHITRVIGPGSRQSAVDGQYNVRRVNAK